MEETKLDMDEMPITNDHVKITKIGLSQNGYGSKT
jgi:hypothetical protein